MTLEISDIKLLPENQLEAYWNYNKYSLINYMKQIQYGLRGIITDQINGEPIVAKVEILDHDLDESVVYSKALHGDYYRLLKEGSYDLHFSAEGYQSQTIQNVEIIDDQSTILDIQFN